MTGVYFAAAALLVFAGGAKVLRPHNTGVALRRAGLHVGDSLVRAGAVIEAVVGAWAFTGNRIAATLLALSYLGFAAFVALALRKGSPISSCGCFGEPDTPPSVLHLMVNLAAAAAAIGGRANVLTVLQAQPLGGLPFVVLTGLIAYLAYLVMAVASKVRTS